MHLNSKTLNAFLNYLTFATDFKVLGEKQPER